MFMLLLLLLQLPKKGDGQQYKRIKNSKWLSLAYLSRKELRYCRILSFQGILNFYVFVDYENLWNHKFITSTAISYKKCTSKFTAAVISF